MKAALQEIRKTSYKPMLLIIIMLLMLCINSMVANYWIDRALANTTTQYRLAYDQVYSKVEGNITAENIKWVVSEKDRLNSQVSTGQFSTEEDLTNTYTGYIFADNNLIDDLYDGMRYAYEYSRFSKDISYKAGENAKLYRSKGSYKVATKYEMMEMAFANRQVSCFYRTDGWEHYLSYEFSNLTSILMIILCVSPLFPLEVENGTDMLLRITSIGVKRIRKNKILVAFLMTLTITVAFSVQDFCTFSCAYHFCGYSNPIYSISIFKNTILTVKIVDYVMINYLLKLIGMWTFTALLLLLSLLCRTSVGALGVGVALFMVEILIWSIAPESSCFALFNSVELCSSFDGTVILGYYFPRYVYATLGQLIISGGATVLVFSIHKGSRASR